MSDLEGHMDLETCYEWGDLFASPRENLESGMRFRANQMGLEQKVAGEAILWLDGDQVRVKFCFLRDPSDIEAVRRIYNDDSNIEVPVCFIVVKQPDPSDDRGDIIFDIFRLSPQSYLWHFNRVFTAP
ncbi:MAG: hypothetical protein JXA25_16640 [Anaerolineales bacterium]|nr:hypothetical protein [Anaerolineales bacterium]